MLSKKADFLRPNYFSKPAIVKDKLFLSKSWSVGLPGLNGFVGEFMSLLGMARAWPIMAVVGVAGVTLAAAYALPAFQAVFLGAPGPGSVSALVYDLDAREKGLLWVMAALMLAIGLYPGPLLRLLEPCLLGLAQ